MNLLDLKYGTVIEGARKLSLAEHADQRHGKFPYSVHLVAVAGVVSCYTQNPDVIAAAWLHDIVEDCESIDLEIIEKMFNSRVRDIVDCLTDPPGPRALTKPISMAKILRDKDASLIKQADRFHNHASTIMEGSAKFAKMYSEEFPDFASGFINSGTAVYPLFDNLIAQYAQLKMILDLKVVHGALHNAT